MGCAGVQGGPPGGSGARWEEAFGRRRGRREQRAGGRTLLLGRSGDGARPRAEHQASGAASVGRRDRATRAGWLAAGSAQHGLRWPTTTRTRSGAGGGAAGSGRTGGGGQLAGEGVEARTSLSLAEGEGRQCGRPRLVRHVAGAWLTSFAVTLGAGHTRRARDRPLGWN